MKTFAISFTLKNQDFNQIKKAISDILTENHYHPEEVKIIHGFMPPEEIEKNGFTDVGIDAFFKEISSEQICFYNPDIKKPDRDRMANYISENGVTVLIIGDIVDGVKEEFDYYMAKDDIEIHIKRLSS